MLKSLFAFVIWERISENAQKQFSYCFSRVFALKISRFLVFPYCIICGFDTDYLEKFEPESKSNRYASYSDFFGRRLKEIPKSDSAYVWPCEGYVCDWGSFASKRNSVIKGQRMDLNDIFATQSNETKNSFFTNIFLHNHNYHRVHSPVNGEVRQILRIEGELLFLRPWLYRRIDVSYPALKNERVIVKIEDEQKRNWYVAMVGGFGVGTIETSAGLQVGSHLKKGQELGFFKLGSTVCMASPVKFENLNYLKTVSAVAPIDTVAELET